MAKKSLYNLTSNGKNFIRGEVYSDEEVADQDLTNFEEIVSEEKAPETPQAPAGDSEKKSETPEQSDQVPAENNQ